MQFSETYPSDSRYEDLPDNRPVEMSESNQYGFRLLMKYLNISPFQVDALMRNLLPRQYRMMINASEYAFPGQSPYAPYNWWLREMIRYLMIYHMPDQEHQTSLPPEYYTTRATPTDEEYLRDLNAWIRKQDNVGYVAPFAYSVTPNSQKDPQDVKIRQRQIRQSTLQTRLPLKCLVSPYAATEPKSAPSPYPARPKAV